MLLHRLQKPFEGTLWASLEVHKTTQCAKWVYACDFLNLLKGYMLCIIVWEIKFQFFFSSTIVVTQRRSLAPTIFGEWIDELEQMVAKF